MAFTLAFTLPHVALLHSVTFYNISGRTWWAKCSPSCLPFLSLSLLYHPKGLTGLRTLTHYSHYSTLQSTTPSPLLYLIANTIPCAPLSVTRDGSSCVLSQQGATMCFGCSCIWCCQSDSLCAHQSQGLPQFLLQWLKKLIHKRTLFSWEAGCTSGNKSKLTENLWSR